MNPDSSEFQLQKRNFIVLADEVLEMAKFYEEIEMLEDVENKLSTLQDEMKQVTVFKNDVNSLLKQIKNL